MQHLHQQLSCTDCLQTGKLCDSSREGTSAAACPAACNWVRQLTQQWPDILGDSLLIIAHGKHDLLLPCSHSCTRTQLSGSCRYLLPAAAPTGSRHAESRIWHSKEAAAQLQAAADCRSGMPVRDVKRWLSVHIPSQKAQARENISKCIS